MNVRLIEQLIELNAVVKRSRLSSNSGHGTFIQESSCCLFLYLFFIIIFITLLLCLATVSFRWYAVLFFQTLRFIRIKYIRIHGHTFSLFCLGYFMYLIERSVRFASYIPYTNKSIVYV